VHLLLKEFKNFYRVIPKLVHNHCVTQ